MKQGKKVLVTQIKGTTGRESHVVGTLKALGLGRRGRSTTLTVNPAVGGMLNKVRHLIQISEA